MNILAIETSTPRASLALFESESSELVWKSEFVTDRAHNSKIFEPLAEALEISDQTLRYIAVGLGPGSYSGVRVGIAVANGIGLVLGIPIVGISSLEAYHATESNFLVVGDARRKSFFVARVNDHSLDNDLELLDETEFANRITSSDPENPIFTPDQSIAEKFANVVVQLPTAEGIALRALSLYGKESEIPQLAIEPHYLRPPYITEAKKKPVPGFPDNSLNVPGKD